MDRMLFGLCNTRLLVVVVFVVKEHGAGAELLENGYQTFLKWKWEPGFFSE